ncbi:MAG TPA: DUF3147 family protein [Candidatus Sulfotelmatobacter sp.]
MKMLKVQIDFSSLKQTKWYEYGVRFGFGGAVTAAAGMIAKHWGPEIGGLFLAFPAIFPASATLIEKDEKEKKMKAGLDGTNRGRLAAGLDAAGATLGSLGLAAFAFVVWNFLGHHSTWSVLLGATFTWMLLSFVLWYLRKTKYGIRLFQPRRQRQKYPSTR